MQRWTMTEDRVTDLKVTAIALGAVMTLAMIGFMLELAMPPI